LTKGKFIDSISEKLTREQPAALVPGESASVAVILRVIGGEEDVLLIKRAEREEDPWSGQIAFPGGMVSKVDSSFEKTAKRETMEEVGIDLSYSGAVFLGYMRELKARMREIVVVPSVFRLDRAAATTLSREVASYLWVSLNDLSAKKTRSTYFLHRDNGEIPFPSLVHRDLVIWGLTERILSTIMQTQEEQGSDAVLGKVEGY